VVAPVRVDLIEHRVERIHTRGGRIEVVAPRPVVKNLIGRIAVRFCSPSSISAPRFEIGRRRWRRGVGLILSPNVTMLRRPFVADSAGRTSHPGNPRPHL
jgi:hypothetical protein